MIEPVNANLQVESRPAAQEKIRESAAEFEGILLAQIMEKLRDCYRLDDEQQDPAGQSMQSIATTALANGLGRHGGLGLGQMMVRSLEPKEAATGPG